MIKKTLILAAIVLGACLIYLYMLPAITAEPQYVHAPEICCAIKDFANRHMQGKSFDIPRNAEKWLVEQVLIHKLEDLPGPHGKKVAKTTVQGSYWIPQGEYSPPKQKSFEAKLHFNIGKKYPEGINVQYRH
ncbi:MAG: hypothetical protein RBR69_02765 [Candidatus Cloacimonadaceae bacterium]|nr:hypothetical protein [Candidatus Cloacimonadota bacterium]MDY0127038.1 hypothetical protein [Candidatus Cloacimonadaceae bacterium]MCB5254110.1 hypothetical protein [Candidatus Cloacimonadota bacterium]MCK9177697.1 hypothetical protein [Candidatus Cloacimonadota bacterium]MCK9241670.1 hypothetical protein [Candidatus Cloacimonadota bacterium]